MSRVEVTNIEHGLVRNAEGSYKYVIKKIDIYKNVPANYPADLIRPAHLCGYIQSSRKLEDYETTSIRVHGGCTFNDELDGFEGNWVGFDCGHYDDTPEKCDVPYVRAQLEKLAPQVHELEKEPLPNLKVLRHLIKNDEWFSCDETLVAQLINSIDLHNRDMLYWRERCNYLEDKLRELGCVVKP